MASSEVRNVLFIMCDQLRWDHLSCYGHPYLHTPHIDALARRGLRFERAFVNSGVCGPSRMSYYTGRYPSSHGVTWNRVPLPLGEITLGEYLKDAGRRCVLAGKSHVMPDHEGLRRYGLAEGDSALAALLARGHFEEIERYDGHHQPGAESRYPDFLRAQGYDSADPWSDFVISGVDARGQVRSGWQMRHAYLPARVAEPHSETAFMTDQALRFVESQGDEPWVLHLSYVKPHWPYMAPTPYHALYTPEQCLPVQRCQSELQEAHPVLAAYREHEESRSFQMDDCIRTVRPVYQGLIKQLDDQLGRLFELLERRQLMRHTLVIFCSDHGDFLGDHWLGEKELFFDTVQRVPLIVVDPSPAAEARRGQTESRLVEGVDILPTILESLGLQAPAHRLEGRSLLALTRGEPEHWRGSVFSELDWSFKQARLRLGRTVEQCHAWSLRNERWRYVYWLDAPEQLYDLAADPEQFCDLGRNPSHAAQRQQLREELFQWLLHRKQRRTSISHAQIEAGTAAHKRAGVFYGQW